MNLIINEQINIMNVNEMVSMWFEDEIRYQQKKLKLLTDNEDRFSKVPKYKDFIKARQKTISILFEYRDK